MLVLENTHLFILVGVVSRGCHLGCHVDTVIWMVRSDDSDARSRAYSHSTHE